MGIMIIEILTLILKYYLIYYYDFINYLLTNINLSYYKIYNHLYLNNILFKF